MCQCDVVFSGGLVVRCALLLWLAILPHSWAEEQGELPLESDWELLRYSLPEGGTVHADDTALMVVADLDGDGVDERMVGTQKWRNGTFGVIWKVYGIEGERYKYRGHTDFRVNGFAVLPDAEGVPRFHTFRADKLQLLTPDSTGESGSLTRTDVREIGWADAMELFSKGQQPLWKFSADDMYLVPSALSFESIKVSPPREKADPRKRSNKRSPRLNRSGNGGAKPPVSGPNDRYNLTVNVPTESSRELYYIAGLLTLAALSIVYMKVWKR